MSVEGFRGASQMPKYRVAVHAYVVMDAKSNSDARAKAELAVRQAVADSYRKAIAALGR